MDTIKRSIKNIFNEKVDNYIDYLGYSPYKNQITLEKRLEQSKRIMEKYPERLPIICDVSKKLPPLDKHKYLIPYDLKTEAFMYIIRRRIKLNEEQAMYFFVGDKLLQTNRFMSEIYEKCKDEDGFLYVYACAESTFG
jgi:GABA(A) receptor-associated protein